MEVDGADAAAAADVTLSPRAPLRTQQCTRDLPCPTTYFRLRMCARAAGPHPAAHACATA